MVETITVESMVEWLVDVGRTLYGTNTDLLCENT